MKKTALVILAAGLGSRFGGGIKQLEPVGPKGQLIMEYSIYDALEAGFNKVVFIIRRDLEQDFKQMIGNKLAKMIEVEYAFQELDDLPIGFSVPKGRSKPWGTGQALLACRDLIKEPFVVINADDYYGKEGFRRIHEYLIRDKSYHDRIDICMAGFRLGNTLSDHGGVTRGICKTDENGRLTAVHETRNIIKTQNGAEVEIEGKRIRLDTDDLVSMNMWGLTPEFLEVLVHGFTEFLTVLQPNDQESEYLLPVIVDRLISEERAQVTVLKSDDTWFGVTYREDKQIVVNAFKKLVEDGVYKADLFEC